MDTTSEIDILIIGAGISGLGAAAFLRTRRPQTSLTIVEARDAVGGTWDLFRYPGIRSDSDLYTFGYDFKPWREESSIAQGDRIRSYLRETVDEYGLARSIQFGQRVISSDWDTATARWTTIVKLAANGERREYRSRWIFSATGYYRYDAGYTPDLPGLDDFTGDVIHPQFWPENLDYSNKRVLVVGSGATAVTLVPALAKSASHVTMLQRTPSYILSSAARDKSALRLRKLLGDERAYPLIRARNVTTQRILWNVSRRWPKLMRRFIRWTNIKQLPEGYDVDKHFNPPYDPWDQRLCLVPDGDFFTAIRGGNADVATDRIRSFDQSGVALESGTRIDADIVVTATGLNLQPLGGISLSIDHEKVDLSKRIAFKGLMLSGVPNFAYAIGYTNASWTLKVGLLCEHFCRLLDHMDSEDYAVCTPTAPVDMETRPLLDFGAGYVQRVVDTLPRQGVNAPRTTSADYPSDIKVLRKRSVADPALRFTKAKSDRTVAG